MKYVTLEANFVVSSLKRCVCFLFIPITLYFYFSSSPFLFVGRFYWKNSPMRPECDSECRKRILCDLKSGRSNARKTTCATVHERVEAQERSYWRNWIFSGITVTYVWIRHKIQALAWDFSAVIPFLVSGRLVQRNFWYRDVLWLISGIGTSCSRKFLVSGHLKVNFWYRNFFTLISGIGISFYVNFLYRNFFLG